MEKIGSFWSTVHSPQFTTGIEPQLLGAFYPAAFQKKAGRVPSYIQSIQFRNLSIGYGKTFHLDRPCAGRYVLQSNRAEPGSRKPKTPQ